MAEELNEKKRALSGWPMIVAWLAMLLFAFQACTHMVAAGDTWVAMACGRHFINHGVNTVEPFSANSHKAGPTEQEVATWPGWAQWITYKVGLETVKKIQPTGWVNQNWLTHVMFYWLTHLSPVADAKNFSFDALVYWKVALYIVTVICVYYTGRILGANPALAAAFACFAMFVSRSFLDIRPAGFSNLLVAAFLLVLVLATYRNILYLWLTVPMTVFWCNVHGGYIYVFIMLAVFFYLHFMAAVPKRWTASLHSIVTWSAAYFLAVRFLSSTPSEYIGDIFNPVNPLHDKFLFVLFVLAVASVATAATRKTKAEVFYGYHAVGTVVVLMWALARFLTVPSDRGMGPNARQLINEHIAKLQGQFFIAAVVLICLGLILMLLKDRLMRLSARKLGHVAAVGLSTFVACMIFNPFHLTNFTHTFIISVSKHAAMWRTVHEWHPAFEWSNPVGTGFPYLVMVLLLAGLLILWLFSRFMRPVLTAAGKVSPDGQKRNRKLNSVFGWAAGVLLLWAALVSLSLCPAETGLFVSIVLVGIIFLSVRYNVHAIFIAVPALWIIVAVANQSKGYAGTYVYPFLLVPVFVVFFLTASVFSQKLEYKPVNIAYAAAASLVTIILMVVTINPFKFQSVSGEFGLIDYASQFFHIQRPWRPEYEANLGTLSKAYNSYLFTGIYIANLAAVAVWFVVPAIARLLRGREQKEQAAQPAYMLGNIDLAYMAVAVLTVYMAYASRRFIPIAAYAACPLLAMLIDRTVRTVSASSVFCKSGRFEVPAMPVSVQRFLAGAGVLVAVSFGIFTFVRFKEVYLDPSPTDPKFTSVFMRMTASHAKPFIAMKFIRENNLSGKMFNYWTEGGFIAYGQNPDPNTGKTPLQLFMDGRAQAAYQPEAFTRWNNIMNGTPRGAQIVESARVRGRGVTDEEYKQIGYFLSDALRKENVWVVLMPLDPKADVIINSLEHNPEWALVFCNDKQRLYVDTETDKGRALYAGIADGTTKFPNEFSRDLTMASDILRRPASAEAAKTGLEDAVAALKLNPSRFAIAEILSVPRELKPAAASICYQFVKDFVDKKSTYLKQDGYANRYSAAAQAAGFLYQISAEQKDKDKYRQYLRSWQQEMSEVNEQRTW
jgi:hypothetical protein